MLTFFTAILAALLASFANVGILRKELGKFEDVLILVSSVFAVSLIGQIAIHFFRADQIGDWYFTFLAFSLLFVLITTFLLGRIFLNLAGKSEQRADSKSVSSEGEINRYWMSFLIAFLSICIIFWLEPRDAKLLLLIFGSFFLLAWWVSFRSLKRHLRTKYDERNG